jgi:hypothetical protein
MQRICEFRAAPMKLARSARADHSFAATPNSRMVDRLCLRPDQFYRKCSFTHDPTEQIHGSHLRHAGDMRTVDNNRKVLGARQRHIQTLRI